MLDKDWRFLYRKYSAKITGRRKDGGFKWDNSLFVPQRHEKSLESVILRPGSCFVDIGANVGRWSIPASEYYSSVVAFEANPRTAKVLRKNVKMNRVRNLTVHDCALSDSDGKKLLFIYDGIGHDSFSSEHLGLKSSGESIKIETRTLDDFQLDPSLIKIDAEGAEIPILMGSLKTVHPCRPALLVVECHLPGDDEKVKFMLPEYSFESVILYLPSQVPTLIGQPRT